jgi:O-antigen ligase
MLLSNKNMKNNSRSKITNQGTLCAFTLVSAIFGVQIVMIVPIFLNQLTTPFSIAFRIFSLCIALFLIFGELSKFKTPKIKFVSVVALLFWTIYTVRMIYDLEVAEVHLLSVIYQNKKFMIYQFEIGATVIPIFALALNVKYINLIQTIRFYYWAALLNTLSILYITNKITGGISVQTFAYRQGFAPSIGEGNIDFGTPINPIVVSISGASLFILSLSILLFMAKNKEYKLPQMQKIFLRATLLLGLIVLFLGSSRGPFLSGILTSLLIIFFYFRSIKFSVRYTFFLLCVVFLSYIGTANYIERNGITLSMIDRITKTADEKTSGEEEHRDILFRTAIEQFIQNPLLGDQIFERFDYSYPHNIIIESFMATGMVGGILLLIMLFTVLSIGLRLFINNNYLASILFFITFFQLGLSLTSGNIFSAPEMWIPFSFTLFSTEYVQKAGGLKQI